eukprot:TRINITY_DN29136_c0_g1_i1.p2 TRINITY_DN29136_c0_g1~~TRINITY_DN29136_c0_g1_i1.p2  ORF type:complete len:117 (-),score=14.69 TRINITY_DN29136_c0_g1_i1:4-354(-)
MCRFFPYSILLKTAFHGKLLLNLQPEKKVIDDVLIFAAIDNEIVIEAISEDELDIRNDSRFGELLVKEGYLEESEITETMDKHHKIGEELVKDGKVTKKIVDSIAQKQQEIPCTLR